MSRRKGLLFTAPSFYELGIAHGIGIPTILITKNIDELPFDLKQYKTIEYSLRYDEVDEFTSEMSDIAEKHKNGDISFGNPVSDYSDDDVAQISAMSVESVANREKDTDNSKKRKRLLTKACLSMPLNRRNDFPTYRTTLRKL